MSEILSSIRWGLLIYLTLVGFFHIFRTMLYYWNHKLDYKIATTDELGGLLVFLFVTVMYALSPDWAPENIEDIKRLTFDQG